MKKKILILGIGIILIVALFALTGCSNKENDEHNSQNNQNNSENFENEGKSSNVRNSSENTIKAYFKSIENGNKTDEYVDTKIYLAMLYSGEYKVDYEEIYNAISNLDKGANYINENCKNYSDAMLKEYNEPGLSRVGEEREKKTEITDSDIAEIKENLKEVENAYREIFNTIEKALNSVKFKVDKIEKTEDVEDIEAYKLVNKNVEFYNVSILFEYKNQEYNIGFVFMLSKEDNKSYITQIPDFLGDEEGWEKFAEIMEKTSPSTDKEVQTMTAGKR